MARWNRSAVKKSGRSKVKKLNKEAFKVVDEKAFEIADALLKSTLAGHVLSARLLVDLAEGDVEGDEALTMRPLRSLALELANEPQWTGDSSEPDAESDPALND
jgi:hypothetical protein